MTDPSQGLLAPSPTMTVPELAERVGVDVSTAYRYLRAGALPGVQVGSSWLVDRERVNRFMDGLEDAAGTPLVQSLASTGPERPGLTLLPDRPPDTACMALAWLRGAHAALGLLLDAASEAPAATNHESNGQRLTGA